MAAKAVVFRVFKPNELPSASCYRQLGAYCPVLSPQMLYDVEICGAVAVVPMTLV